MGKLGNTLVRAAQGPQAANQKPGALDRISALESFRDGVLRAMRSTFAAVEQRLSSNEEIIHALINLMGSENVEREVTKLAIAKMEERSVKEKAGFEAAVKRGELVLADEVGDSSVIIGSEVDKDGNSLHPLRCQLLYATVKQGYKEKLKGAKVGDSIDTPAGSKFTVNEIWNVLPPEERPKQAEAPAAAASEDATPEGTADVKDEVVDEKVEAELVEELSKQLN